MFTKNWYKAAASLFSGMAFTFTTRSGGSQGASTYDSFLRYGKNYSGPGYPSMYYVRTSYYGDSGVVFGTGTTPPTIDDYCLSGDLITGISCSAVVSNADDDNGVTTTAVYTVTNANSEDITIGEIGLMASLDNTSSSDKKAFIERTVLDTPITIPAGGVGQVTYTIRMNYPTA